MTGKRSVAVRILGQEYRIRTDGDEESVQRTAALVDETMKRIRERTRTVDSLDLAVLAALNLASELIGSRSAPRGDAEWIDAGRVRSLIQAVESAGVQGR
jgi:cell division protein ZapA